MTSRVTSAYAQLRAVLARPYETADDYRIGKRVIFAVADTRYQPIARRLFRDWLREQRKDQTA